jgi:hypothetical protein
MTDTDACEFCEGVVEHRHIRARGVWNTIALTVITALVQTSTPLG